MNKQIFSLNKYFLRLFPIIDYLYIFQLLEYEVGDFLRWFVRHPFKRDLQKKNQLSFTVKAELLFFISLILVGIVAHSLVYALSGSYDPFLYLIIFLLLLNVSPLFLVVANLVVLPFEIYKKNQIIKLAQEKMGKSKDLKVVAIVGSFAKTSTKNMLYTLLWKDFRVVKTPKSFNTAISIARTVLRDIKDNSEVFLVEMDAYHKGEIANLTKIVTPDLGILTAIAPQHLERFGSMDCLAKTQFELAEGIKKSGALFLNSEDEWIIKLENLYPVKKIFYGKQGDYYASDIKQTLEGTFFNLHSPKGAIKILLPLLGEHHIINFLAASSVAESLGLSLKRIAQRAKLMLPTPHRLEVRKTGQITLIDNTYNTNPVVAKASLKLLNDLPGDQRVLITPGLVELGKEKQAKNEEFAEEASKVADEIIVVGQNARAALLKGLEKASYSKERIHLVSSTNEGLIYLNKISKPNAVVLLENDLPDQYS